MLNKKTKGFTLIELLIVIAIIGILAGVILVSTSSAQNKAREQAGRSTMRSALTYMVLCTSGGSTLATYNANANLCSNTSIVDAKWPAAPSGCTNFAVSGNLFNGTCGGANISCNAISGSCN